MRVLQLRDFVIGRYTPAGSNFDTILVGSYEGIELDPKNFVTYNGWGVALSFQGKYDVTRGTFRNDRQAAGYLLRSLDDRGRQERQPILC